MLVSKQPLYSAPWKHNTEFEDGWLVGTMFLFIRLCPYQFTIFAVKIPDLATTRVSQSAYQANSKAPGSSPSEDSGAFACHISCSQCPQWQILDHHPTFNDTINLLQRPSSRFINAGSQG